MLSPVEMTAVRSWSSARCDSLVDMTADLIAEKIESIDNKQADFAILGKIIF